MKLFQKLVCMALTATATASLSICAFAADYTFDTAADTDYYPSTSYEDTYGTAYHYGSKNLVDYQIPELPYGVLSTTQTGVMEKLRLPGLQQTVGGSASGVYGVDSGVGIPAVTPVISSYDPDKGNLQQHIFAQLKYELLNCKAAFRLCGMTGAPRGFQKSDIISLDIVSENSELHEQLLAA